MFLRNFYVGKTGCYSVERTYNKLDQIKPHYKKKNKKKLEVGKIKLNCSEPNRTVSNQTKMF